MRGESSTGLTSIRLARCRAVARGGLDVDPEVRPTVRDADRRRAADLPAVCLLTETAISQYGEEFMLFAAVNPQTRHLLHAEVAPTRNYLTSWRFFEYLRELYSRGPPIVVTDGATMAPSSLNQPSRTSSVNPACATASNAGFEIQTSIDTFYASFPWAWR